MNRAARAVQRGASAVGFKFEYGTAANCVLGDRFAGAEAGGAGEAKNVVRRKRDDLVVAASSALVTEVGKFALPVFLSWFGTVHVMRALRNPPADKLPPL